jgi:hypothetical protein
VAPDVVQVQAKGVFAGGMHVSARQRLSFRYDRTDATWVPRRPGPHVCWTTDPRTSLTMGNQVRLLEPDSVIVDRAAHQAVQARGGIGSPFNFRHPHAQGASRHLGRARANLTCLAFALAFTRCSPSARSVGDTKGADARSSGTGVGPRHCALESGNAFGLQSELTARSGQARDHGRLDRIAF